MVLPKGLPILLNSFLIALIFLCVIPIPGRAQQTPPIQPKVQETALPPAVELPPPPSIPSDVPNRPLSAEEAARIALNHQPNVGVAQAGVEAAKGKQQQARSGLLPSLGTSASYNHVSGAASSSAGGYLTTATLRQLVFDFSHTRDLVKQAEAGSRSASAGLSQVQSDTVLQVKQQFYTYAQNVRLVAVNEANLRNQQSHLAAAQARLKAGVGLPSDVVRAETAVSDAIFSLNLARNSASVSQVTLAEQMGIDPRTPVQPADAGEAPVPVDDLDAIVAQALKERPEMIQARANIESAELGLSAAKTGNAPSLGATLGTTKRGSDFPPNDNSWTAGVAIQWDAFDSGFTAGLVKQAKAGLEASNLQMESTRLAIISAVFRLR